MPTRTSQSPNGKTQPALSNMHYGASGDLFEFAKELRRNQTHTEEKLWNRIKNRQLGGYKFRRQHPIDKYIADFYCHELRYVIELDGGYHLKSAQIKYDFNRDGDMTDYGIHVRRIKDELILNSFEKTIQELLVDIAQRKDHLLKEAGR